MNLRVDNYMIMQRIVWLIAFVLRAQLKNQCYNCIKSYMNSIAIFKTGYISHETYDKNVLLPANTPTGKAALFNCFAEAHIVACATKD